MGRYEARLELNHSALGLLLTAQLEVFAALER